MNTRTNTEQMSTETARTILAGISIGMLHAGKFPRETALAIWYTLKHDSSNYTPEQLSAFRFAIIRSRVRRRCNKGKTEFRNKWGKRITKELHPECFDPDSQLDITNEIFAMFGSDAKLMAKFCYNIIDEKIYRFDRLFFNKGTKYWECHYYKFTDGIWQKINWKQYRKEFNPDAPQDYLREDKIIVRNLSDTAECPESRTYADIPDYSDSKIHNILARLLAKGMTLSQIANRTGRNWKTIYNLAKQLHDASKIRDKYATDPLEYAHSQPDHRYNARYTIAPGKPTGNMPKIGEL